MKVINTIRNIAMLLAATGMLTPYTSAAVTTGGQTEIVTDVALQEGGILQGQVVDRQGAPQANSNVLVSYQGAQVATARTDAEGRFSVTGLRGGVHGIQTAEATGVYRLWAPQTAPPAATGRVLFVNGGLAQRGQAFAALTVTQFAVAGGAVAGGVWLIDEITQDDNGPSS